MILTFSLPSTFPTILSVGCGLISVLHALHARFTSCLLTPIPPPTSLPATYHHACCCHPSLSSPLCLLLFQGQLCVLWFVGLGRWLFWLDVFPGLFTASFAAACYILFTIALLLLLLRATRYLPPYHYTTIPRSFAHTNAFVYGTHTTFSPAFTKRRWFVKHLHIYTRLPFFLFALYCVVHVFIAIAITTVVVFSTPPLTTPCLVLYFTFFLCAFCCALHFCAARAHACAPPFLPHSKKVGPPTTTLHACLYTHTIHHLPTPYHPLPHHLFHTTLPHVTLVYMCGSAFRQVGLVVDGWLVPLGRSVTWVQSVRSFQRALLRVYQATRV